jgi:hypothetical protein
MVRFIKRFILFTLPIIIAMIAVELFLRNIPNDYSFKKDHLDKESENVQVLFLGNSHFFFGINPEYMSQRSFNAVHISQSLNFDLAILEKYNSRWKNLKYIIIPVDYFSLYTTLDGSEENWRVKNYSIYYGIPPLLNYFSSFEIFNGKLSANFLRIKTYFVDHKSDVTCNKFGFGTTYNSKDCKNLDESGITAIKRHTVDVVKNQTTFLENIQVLQSIIKFAHNHNVKIIFATCPAYAAYTDKLDALQYSNTVNKIIEMSTKQKNTFYYNYLYDSAFTKSDFFDADHLNEIGAKKFTLKLDSLITTLDNKGK